jgi:hypothetical protein
MTEIKNTAWARHIDTIGDELLRLTTVCGVDLQVAGAIERVIQNDETVCSKKNTIGFRKLRELVMATFGSLNKSMDRIGPAETKMIVDAIRERLDRRRELGGTKPASATPRDQAKKG